MCMPTVRTGSSSWGALRIELFGGQFHIADSSSFFFKGCKIIGIITKVPLYSIKVTGGVPGPYQLWGEMFGSWEWYSGRLLVDGEASFLL